MFLLLDVRVCTIWPHRVTDMIPRSYITGISNRIIIVIVNNNSISGISMAAAATITTWGKTKLSLISAALSAISEHSETLTPWTRLQQNRLTQKQKRGAADRASSYLGYPYSFFHPVAFVAAASVRRATSGLSVQHNDTEATTEGVELYGNVNYGETDRWERSPFGPAILEDCNFSLSKLSAQLL